MTETILDTERADELRRFALVALPTGWVLLSVPLVVNVPVEPFVLLTLLVGLVIPAVILTHQAPDTSVRVLLRDVFRLPRPLLWLLPALALLPAATWLGARVADAARAPTANTVLGFVTALAIVNLWEEMAWTGFVQRRAMRRWGYLRGSLLTTALFGGVHLPLVFADADDVGDVALGLGAIVVAGAGLRLLIGHLDLASSRSLLAVGALHASFNSSAELVDADHDWIRYAVTLALGVAAAVTHVRQHDHAQPADEGERP